MQDLATTLSALVGKHFSDLGMDAALGAVKRSDRADLGDFQCNGALAGAKQRGQNPRALAEELVKSLGENELFESVSLAGPGFINFRLKDTVLAKQIDAMVGDAHAGVSPDANPRKVLVDFAGPNVAKPMHVGHLRATIIGDSLQRIARFIGHTVTSDAHFGDWGLQIGLLIISLQDEQPDLPYFREDYSDALWIDTPPVTMEDLDRMYPAASAKMKGDDAYRDRARKATAELQKGRAGYLALHKHFWKVSQVALNREFTALDIHFDLWKGESDVNYLIDEVVEEFKAKGIAHPSEGALIVDVTRPDDKGEKPPLLLISSEGSAMYGTTDLATILERKREVNPDLYLYCVDQRQALHFVQVFRAAVKAGYATDEQLEHIGFGTMNGTDGKPFKTRAGDVVKLHDLITTSTEKALEKMEAAGLAGDLDPEDKARTAKIIGSAALKFADLSNYRMTNYVFDIDRFTTFEGKTGPYLQYQGVRIRTLLRKAADISEGPLLVTAPEERALILALDNFHNAVHQAFERRAPNFVADHVYTVAGAWSTLWSAVQILKEPDEAIRASRLRLARATLRQLEAACGLLGITIPERM